MSALGIRGLGERLARKTLKRSTGEGTPDPGATKEGDEERGVEGFDGDTSLESSFGTLPAKFVRRGDPLRVGPDDYLPVKAVRAYHFEPELLRRRPDILPIVLEARTSYANLAKGSIVVAPGQRIRLSDHFVREGNRLVPASDLSRTRPPGYSPGETITYYRFEFEKPVCIYGGGYWFAV